MNTAEALEHHLDEIMDRWSRGAQEAASARGLTSPELTNLLPDYLHVLASDGRDPLPAPLLSHVSDRIRQGFDLSEIVEELRLLERAIQSTLDFLEPPARPAEAERLRLSATIQDAIVRVTDVFWEHMRLDEQQEKMYRRLVRQMADEVLRDPSAGLADHLRQFVELLVDATGADSVVLILFDKETGRPATSASAGVGADELARVASSLDPATLAATIVSSHGTTRVEDLETTELPVSHALRHGGIHAVLGLRLPPRHRLLGVVLFGLRERRQFTSREIRRCEAMAGEFTLHMENARLYEELRAQVHALTDERQLREHFVTILAHDLRGPLASAKLGAHLLAAGGSSQDQRDVTKRVLRNLEQAERMIKDLLDVSRVRSGQRLPLDVEDCDLRAIVQDVIADLSRAHGERFELVAPDAVRGHWGADELRRALWNLGTNAVKYGHSDKPITFRLDTVGLRVRASVHNYGPSIPAAHRGGVFDMYSQLDQANHPAGGWGIGLAVVKACAEAHGGSVGAESTEGAGTTFFFEIPRDARQVREAPDPPLGEVPDGAAPHGDS